MIETPTRLSRARERSGSRSFGAALIQNNLIALLLAMIVLVPLVTGTATLDAAGKMVTFEALGAILLAAALGQIRLRGAAGNLRRTLLAGPNLPIVLLLAVTAVSALLSPYKAFSLTELMRVGFCTLLYFVLVSQARGKGQLQTLSDGLLVVTAAVSVFGFVQMGEGQMGAVAGTFGSHELLGSFLMLMLPVCLALGLIERGDPARQTAAQVVSVLAGACLLMARTRSAWLGAAVSLIALSLIALRYLPVADEVRAGRKDMLRSLRQRKHLIIVPILVLFGALALVVGLSQTGGELRQRAGTLSHVTDDESFQARMTLARGAMHMIAARPLFGWGAGTYPVLQSPFTGQGRTPSQVLAHGTDHDNLAHNFYLQTAAETGVVGLGLYLAVVIVFFVTGLRALWSLENGLRKAVLIGSLAAMAAQIVDAVGSPAYNFASVSLFQWTLMGLGMAAAGVGSRSRAEAVDFEAERATGISAPLGRGLRYAACGLIALGIMSQIIPTMPAALAQTCTISNNSFVLVGLQGQDSGTSLTGTGSKLTLIGKFNNSPARNTTFTITGATYLVTTANFSPLARLDIIRNSTPGSGQILVTATDTEAGTPYTNTFVVQLN